MFECLKSSVDVLGVDGIDGIDGVGGVVVSW